MIEIRYKRILFFQAFFLFILGVFLYNFFKQSFDLHHISSTFWITYLTVWAIFIIFNLVFIKFFALPAESLLKKLETSTTPGGELSWSVIEDSLSKRDVHHQIIQSEYEIENLKYKILLDSLHDPVCIFNKNQSILYSNQAFDQLFSLPENSPQASLLEVTRNLYFQDFLTKAILTNEAQKLNEFSFNPIQDGFKKFFEIKVFPLKNIQNYLCIMHDVTERKLADQMREDFVSNFSHEVRTPLTILKGQMHTLRTELEKNSNFNTDYKIIFDKVDKNSKRLINLFNDLLQLTSVEKKKDLVKEEIVLEPMIDGLFEELSQNYPQKNIKYTFDFRTKTFLVDYNLFEQVMINLIDNAYKYVGALGNITVTTHTEGLIDILEISDDGMGIPEDQQHRIFERFFRVDTSRSSDIEGTGLGLSIVKHIIHKHDGKIKVASHKGKGTTFTISLPAC
ncbi:MAG: PAS domain-containing protein [Bacteriovorax sp.]|nr:PAS domain-containing protein [Bacteriovorax sp.]